MLKPSNKYLRFLVNAILFLLIIIVLDQIIGRSLEHFYFKIQSGDDKKTAYSLDSTEAQIIILGTSRARHHYIPTIIEDSLKMTCYNTGRDGNFLFYNFAIFKSIVKRYSPKIIILDINPSGLHKKANVYQGLASLLPYYKSKPELHQIIELSDRSDKYKILFSTIYPFNSKLVSIITGNLRQPAPDGNKGYIPLEGSSMLDNKPVVQVPDNSEFDDPTIKILEDMALTCEEKKIKLYFVQSPSFMIASQEKENNLLDMLSKKYKFRYFNFVNDSLFIKNPGYFKDDVHLNNVGASLFTSKLIQKLKSEK